MIARRTSASTDVPFDAYFDDEKQMTLDEYKKLREDRKKLNSLSTPKLNIRAANEGVDARCLRKFESVYEKTNNSNNEDKSRPKKNSKKVDKEKTTSDITLCKQLEQLPDTSDDNFPDEHQIKRS